MSFRGSVNILTLEHSWVDIRLCFPKRKSILNVVKLEIYGPKAA